MGALLNNVGHRRDHLHGRGRPGHDGPGPVQHAAAAEHGPPGQGRLLRGHQRRAAAGSRYQRIFNDILATNSVFASASLPLSADNSGAVGQPGLHGRVPARCAAAAALARQPEAIQVRSSTRTKRSARRRSRTISRPARSGFAHPDAESFWTSKNTTQRAGCDHPQRRPTRPTAAPAASGTSTARAAASATTCRTAQWVEKGGAAQQLRLRYLGYGGAGGIGDTNASTLNSQAARKVYTCTAPAPPTRPCPAIPSNTYNAATSAAITTTALGAADATALQTMIKWIRGQDTAEREQLPGQRRQHRRARVHPWRRAALATGRAELRHAPRRTRLHLLRRQRRCLPRHQGRPGRHRRQRAVGVHPDRVLRQVQAPVRQQPVRCCTRAPRRASRPTPTRRDYFFDGPVATLCGARRHNSISKAYPVHQHAPRRTPDLCARRHQPTNPKFLWKKSYARLRVCRAAARPGRSRRSPRVNASTEPGPDLRRRLRQRVRGHRAAGATDSMGRAIYVLTPSPARPCGPPASRARTSAACPPACRSRQSPAWTSALPGTSWSSTARTMAMPTASTQPMSAATCGAPTS